MEEKYTEIKGKDLLKDVFAKYPKVIEIYIKKGFGCVGCLIRKFETIEDSCKSHNVKDIDAFIKYLNENKI